MEIKWRDGPPTEPGRYDCIFDNGMIRYTYNILSVGIDGTIMVLSSTGRGDPFKIKAPSQYFGPIPDPPKPLPDKPMFFKCRHKDSGLIGHGVYIPPEESKKGWMQVLWIDGHVTTASMLFFGTLYEILEWLEESSDD